MLRLALHLDLLEIDGRVGMRIQLFDSDARLRIVAPGARQLEHGEFNQFAIVDELKLGGHTVGQKLDLFELVELEVA